MKAAPGAPQQEASGAHWCALEHGGVFCRECDQRVIESSRPAAAAPAGGVTGARNLLHSAMMMLGGAELADSVSVEGKPGMFTRQQLAELIRRYLNSTLQAARAAEPDLMAAELTDYLLREFKIEVLPNAREDDMACITVGTLLRLAAKATTPQGGADHGR